MSSNTATVPHVPIPRNGVDYRGKVVLAPMVRSGELPSRLLALKYGADLVWGPETIDRALIGCTRQINQATSTIDFVRTPTGQLALPPDLRRPDSVIYSIHPELERGKLIYQIGTASPTLAVEAAKLIAADVAGIDLNSGCPKPFSTSGGMGAALLRTPDLLCSILEALVQEVGQVYHIGISVKIRLLETPEMTEALVRRLVKTGITGLTIHCRTTPMRPRERAIREQLRMIVDVCHEAGVACLMNGDVENRPQALQLMEEYAADGAMIATAAEKNSSVFLPDSPRPWQEVVVEYMRYAAMVENRWGNTKFLLSQLIPGKHQKYKDLDSCRCYVAVMEMLDMKDPADLESARKADKALRIPHGKLQESKKEKKERIKAYKKEVDQFLKARGCEEGVSENGKRTNVDLNLDEEEDLEGQTAKKIKVPEHDAIQPSEATPSIAV